MTDFSAFVQNPGLTGVVPTYTQATAADFFTAQPGAKYMIHYKNAGTITGLLKVTDPTSIQPAGANPVAGFADLQVSTAMPATSERVHVVDSNRFRDSNGRINLTAVTPTTLTIAILGPL